ncbi:MAG TPA: hypothetical protein VM933_05120 [Acidimicrobiales bacterium]|nr:hypothetical protein [Acidimicrobiales bacterium]
MTRLEALVVRAFAVWTVYVWGTRIWNIAQDETTSTAFKVVHSALAVVSVAFAVAAWIVVRRVRRRDRPRAGAPSS